jgi:hypothetical protein
MSDREVTLDGQLPDSAVAERNDRLRGRLLLLSYEAAEQGTLPLFTSQYVATLELTGQDALLRVSNALTYLVDRGYLRARVRRAMGRLVPVHVVTGITPAGIDKIEKAIAKHTPPLETIHESVSGTITATQSEPERRSTAPVQIVVPRWGSLVSSILPKPGRIAATQEPGGGTLRTAAARPHRIRRSSPQGRHDRGS